MPIPESLLGKMAADVLEQQRRTSPMYEFFQRKYGDGRDPILDIPKFTHDDHMDAFQFGQTPFTKTVLVDMGDVILDGVKASWNGTVESSYPNSSGTLVRCAACDCHHAPPVCQQKQLGA